MKFFGKTLGLLLSSLILASCGGGGGNGGAFSPPVSGSITLSATTTTLPLNTQGYLPHQHGPNQAEVTITIRNANGTLMVGHDVSVAISPVNVAALSFLVQDGNDDFDNLWGTFTIKGTNGVATAWVNAETIAGTAVLTASTVDPTTNATISNTLTFTVTSGVGPAPATVDLSPNPAGVYLPSSGGNNNSVVSAVVRDGAGQLVPDPVSGNSGVDNIQFEIVGNAGDAILSSNSVAGPVSGTTVKSYTVNGAATASFQAGETTPQGPVQIRATVDRADNNVSNGIQTPVTSTTSVIVSDGKLFSLELTSPVFASNLPSVTINCVTDPCAAVSGDVTGGSTTIPPNPDATLSLAITALATDRQGNPVLPGTAIHFGSVDEPVGAPGTVNDNQFLISGTDGNPQEGGSTFTAPGGHFTTAGGGAGPGDALIVFGKAVQGNSDLESAVTIQSINSATNATVLPVFNRNDTTGASVDSGPVLPYLMGRSEHGNVTAVGTTNSVGAAHASLTYTVNTVGSSVAVWAQGDGVDRNSGAPKRVTDAGTMVYPGVYPLTLFASPDPIFGNTTQTVTVCATDALGIPLRGVIVGFKFNLTSGGTGSVDGTSSTGPLGHPTGVGGCVDAVAVASGLPVSSAGGNSGTLTFSAGGGTVTIDIVFQIASLSVFPTSVCAVDVTGAPVTVTALSASGTGVSGVAVDGTCTAGITLSPPSAVTGPNGSTVFNIIGASASMGTCTFTAQGTSAQAILRVDPRTPSPYNCAPAP